MRLQNTNFLSIEQLQDQYLNQTKKIDNSKDTSGISFGEILKAKTASEATGSSSTLKFSKHAASRLIDRNIELTDNQIERLSDGTKKAGEKGIQESLVIVDQLAFIVNIPNNTVITAMDQMESNENIFTNIDGAVII